jgi:hypothetical protein
MSEEIPLEAFIERFRADVWFLIVTFRAWYAEKRAEDPETWALQLTLIEWQHALSAFLLECPAAFRSESMIVPKFIPPRTIIPPPTPLPEDEDTPPPVSPGDEEPEKGPPAPWFRVQGDDD